MSSILDKVEIREAGKVFIVSGKDEATVNYVMAELMAEGAVIIGKAGKVGTSWIATFENPLLKQCEHDRQGYRITVTGPSKDIVMLYSEQFIERGAVIEAGPVEYEGKWVLYLLDDADRTNTMYMS